MSFFVKLKPQETQPIDELLLQIGDRRLYFTPHQDISGLEACMVLRLYIGLLGLHWLQPDVDSYLTKHNLWRHFTENGMPCSEGGRSRDA